MASYVNLDLIQRPSASADILDTWGDQVNDNCAFLYGDTSWTQVTVFTNGWAQNTESVQYRLVGTRVHLRGGVSGGTSAGSSAFTLPAGYRPAQQWTGIGWQATTGAAVFIQVTTAGNVTIGVASDLVYLDSVVFDTI